LNIIGKPFTRADAAQKAAGEEKYTAEWYGDDLLWAGVRRSGLAHGRIISVDVSETLSLASPAKAFN
jgi:CO/xanthine dehydrogenase Mo-binding subunit